MTDKKISALDVVLNADIDVADKVLITRDGISSKAISFTELDKRNASKTDLDTHVADNPAHEERDTKINLIAWAIGKINGTEAFAIDEDIKYHVVNDLLVPSGGTGGGAVDSVNGQTGVVVLSSANVPDSTDKRYITDAQKLDVIDIPNKLDSVVAGTDITIDNTDPNNPIISSSSVGGVTSVNTQTGAVVLDTGDIAEVVDKNYVTDAEKLDIATIPNKADAVDLTFENIQFDAVNEINGPVAHIKTLQQVYSHATSAGIDDGCVITDNIDGTVDIASGSVSIRALDDSHSNMLHATIAEDLAIALNNNTTNYLYIDYTAGAPRWVVSTSSTSTNGNDKILGFVIARRDNLLKIIDTRNSSIDFPNKAGELFKAFGRFIHKEGGSLLGASGLNLTVTPGEFFFGVNPVPHGGFDTSVIGTAPENIYSSIYGSFTITDNLKELDNVNYDNAGVLTALGVGKWKTDWLYMVNDSPSTLALIYGDTEYNNIAGAQVATAPTNLPPTLAGVGVLIGRYLVQQGNPVVVAESSFEKVFAAGSVTNHNDLSTLQGGALDEYYHLTAVEQGHLSGQDQPVKTTDNVAFQTTTVKDIGFVDNVVAKVTTSAQDNVLITDSEGTQVIRGNRRYPYEEDFKDNLPSVVFNEVGANVTVSSETGAPLSNVRSLKFTQLGAIANEGFLLANTQYITITEAMRIAGTISLDFIGRFNGDTGNQVFYAQFDNGASWVALQGVDIDIENGDNPYSMQFGIPATATQIRYGINILTPNDLDVLYIDDIAVNLEPFSTIKSAESASYNLQEHQASNMSNLTGYVQFNPASATVQIKETGNSSNLFTVDHSVNPTTITFKNRCEIDTSLSLGVVSANDRAAIFLNDSILDEGTGGYTPSTNSAVSTGTVVNAGDTLKFAMVDSNESIVNSYNANVYSGISLTATATSRNLVSTVATTEYDTNSYNPVITGFGIPTNIDFTYRKVGDSLHINGFFTSGVPTAVEAQIGLPLGLTTSSTIAILGTQLSFLGVGAREDGTPMSILANRSKAYLNISLLASAGAQVAKNGDDIVASGNEISFSIVVAVNELKASDVAISVPVTNEVENYAEVVYDQATDTILHVSGSAGALKLSTLSAGDTVVDYSGYGLANKPNIATEVLSSEWDLDTRMAYSTQTTSQASVQTRLYASATFLNRIIRIRITFADADYNNPTGYFIGKMALVNHSNAETWTGERWIDGRKIYVRSFEVAVDVATNTTLVTIDIGLEPTEWSKFAVNSYGGSVMTDGSGGNFQQLTYNDLDGTVKTSNSAPYNYRAGHKFSIRYVRP